MSPAWVCPPSAETQAGRFTRETARECGSRGGSVTSEAKAIAARQNGKRGGRPRKVGRAWQSIIRERAAVLDPREPLPSLAGCTVRRVEPKSVKAFIIKNEWLATAGRPKAAYALFSPSDELLGAVTFGWTGGELARDICGRENRKVAICLERGACAHFAPRNAASFLISRAVKMAHHDFGWEIFYAYADPRAGEAGVVYQSCNWYFLGWGIGHASPMRTHFIRPNGKIVGTRTLRHGGLKLRDVVIGWRRISLPAKGKYVWFEGPRAKMLKALCRYEFRPYPKRSSD